MLKILHTCQLLFAPDKLICIFHLHNAITSFPCQGKNSENLLAIAVGVKQKEVVSQIVEKVMDVLVLVAFLQTSLIFSLSTYMYTLSYTFCCPN